MPIAGDEGFHRDDWEGVQIRIGPDGSVDERASSHHGYNYAQSVANAGSDAGIVPLRGRRRSGRRPPRNGWGPETRLLLVSGGSHAGNTNGFLRIDRVTSPAAASIWSRWSRSPPAKATTTASRSARPGASASGATPRPRTAPTETAAE